MKLETWCDELIADLPSWTEKKISKIEKKWETAILRGGVSEADASIIASNEIFDEFAPLRGCKTAMKRAISTSHTLTRDKNDKEDRANYLNAFLKCKKYGKAWLKYHASNYNKSLRPQVINFRKCLDI